MKQFKFLPLLLLLCGPLTAQDMVRIVRWVSPVTGDFETLREDFNPDAQLQGWGYKDKLYQFSAYKTRPNDPNATAVNRWVMPNCAASIVIAEHEIPDATLLSRGYKSKQFLFYAYRTKPTSGDFVAVNRWINAKPQGDKCRDFTLTVAETELTDAQLQSYGYSGKVTQFWVPRPGMVRPPNWPDKSFTSSNQPLNPDFESGNLNNWTIVGNGFQVRSGDLPLTTANWGPSSMPLGGDYWQGLTPNFSWNNGRQGTHYASSEGAGTGRVELISSEFKPTKNFITFLLGVSWTGMNWQASRDLPKLRVELLVADNGTAIKQRVQGARMGDYRDPGILTTVNCPQTVVDNKSYSIVETVSLTTASQPYKQQFYRRSLYKYDGICRIRIVDEAADGAILVDNFRLEDTDVVPLTVRPPQTPLWGFVDMHTHPMANLGFGQELVYGSAFGAPQVALGSCNCVHNFVAAPFDGSCGQQNMVRNIVVDKTDEKYKIPVHNKSAGGFPGFGSWPKSASVLHQQMYVDWLRRAYDGGQRVLIALAVNSHVLADAAETAGPNDDLRSMNIQIEQFKSMVDKHRREVDDFFEIAYSSGDLRRIIGSNKLALVIGTETDNIGNFYTPADPKGGVYKANPTDSEIITELDRLYSMGVRYIFPIHITNNLFGGTAIYDNSFNVANKYNTGRPFSIETVPTVSSGVNFTLANPLDGGYPSGFVYEGIKTVTGGGIIPSHIMNNNRANYPDYPNPGTGFGHRNSLGLTREGEVAIKYMMRKGMLIDIDHMSEKTVSTVLDIADQFSYPLNSGHNGPRGSGGSENARTDVQYRRIFKNGGMAGLGTGEASQAVIGFRELISSYNVPIGFGTDANGLYPLPKQPTGGARVNYSSLRQYKMANSTKVWDYNEEGMAHYGLFPDYIQSLKNAGMTAKERTAIFSGAEYFARMWERCEQQKTQVR